MTTGSLLATMVGTDSCQTITFCVPGRHVLDLEVPLGVGHRVVGVAQRQPPGLIQPWISQTTLPGRFAGFLISTVNEPLGWTV